ncbi:hypothetical protein IWZ01DRAFT_507199 [Phyllosticta capitalensis]
MAYLALPRTTSELLLLAPVLASVCRPLDFGLSQSQNLSLVCRHSRHTRRQTASPQPALVLRLRGRMPITCLCRC